MAAKPKKEIDPPRCTHCGSIAELVTGAVIYPRLSYLHTKWIWKCPSCENSYVGCHGKTKRPLGTPANATLRDARGKLHDRMLDPLWKTSIESCGYRPESERAAKIIKLKARVRVYRFLAERLGIADPGRDCHVAMFDIETCRRAWRALQGVTYPEIRERAKQQEDQPE